MNSVINSIRRLPIYPGNLADVARATSLSKGTLSKDGELSAKTKIVIASFLTSQLEKHEKVAEEMRSLITKLRGE